MSHKFRQTLLALTLVSSGMMFTLPASAAPALAQQQTQAPGYYRMMLGNLEVTALYDGYVKLDAKLFHGVSEPDMQSCSPACLPTASQAYRRQLTRFW